MLTRCKFRCDSVKARSVGKNHDGSEQINDEIALYAVSGDENKPWSRFTPSGKLEMTIDNQALIGAFKPGKIYFIDIAEAE